MNDTELLEVKAFCDWFIQNNEIIIKCASTADKDEKTLEYLDMFEENLTRVFAKFYKGKIKFGYGYDHKTDKWTLDLCHLNKKNLIQITKLIKENLSNVSDKWIINISK